ncbi:hypothetical protein RA19_08935 [Leisingera sp. ANG-M1]|uniref:DUF4345 family protein n=1 Tax=Leisingera sp. ANG-M1 TaxID=1577895 RepID=UPI00057E4EDB|nr:DUF4345 family protein [Leisingera sp. ANG-M1]KIC10861.1 hypothetical protein RA19_08935 [Leisingera sp. ANG-M1]
MELALQIVIGLGTLMLAGLGLMSMLNPGKMAGNFGVETTGVVGLSTIRSAMGGMFLSCVAMLAAGQLTGVTLWFVPVAVVMAAIAFGRLISMAFDGFDSQVVPPLVIELVLAAALTTAHMQSAAA